LSVRLTDTTAQVCIILYIYIKQKNKIESIAEGLQYRVNSLDKNNKIAIL